VDPANPSTWSINDPSPTYLWGDGYSDRLRDGTAELIRDGLVRLGYIPEWVKSTINDVEAYWLTYRSNSVGAEFSIVEVEPMRSLRNQDWTKLGTLSAQGTSQTALQFPDNVVGRGIMVMFVPKGTDVSRPEIKRLEIEYIPTGTPLKVVHALIDCGDDLELIDLTHENSGTFVQASLYSMAHGGRTYVVQIPAPGPVGHTMRATVAITEPGGAFPILSYPGRRASVEPGLHSVPPGEIPIRLDEM